MVKRFRHLVLVLALAVVAPLSAEKKLDWDYIHVDALLKNDGTLLVQETQGIRFNGDWNGAYRYYDVGWGQKFEFISLEKKDSSGNWTPLQQGNTDLVDHFSYDKVQKNIRWRSRNVEDPPFEDELIEYRITVLYSGIIQSGFVDGYSLDHDFAFADRAGDVRKMSVSLKWESDWQEKSGTPMPVEFTDSLEPGEKMIVRSDFSFNGDPSVFPPSPWARLGTRILIFLSAVLVLALIQYILYIYNRKKGVFAEPKRFEKWEDVNATLEGLSAVDVAILAEEGKAPTWMSQLMMEGKLKVTTSGESLILEKMVSDSEFSEMDQRIIKDLFVDGKKKVTADDIKDYYRKKKSSFNLGNNIESEYSKRLIDMGILEGNEASRKITEFIFGNITKLSIFVPLLFISFFVFVLFVNPFLAENGIRVEIVSFSIFSLLFTLVLSSALEDDHYGLKDLERHRLRLFYTRFLRSLIPMTIFVGFYIWSMDMREEIIYGVLVIGSMLSLQHLWRYSPHKFINQIQQSLKILSVKNFLEKKLLHDDECDIPMGFMPFIPALGLEWDVEYRIKHQKKEDCLHLLPENIENIVQAGNLDRSSLTSSSFRMPSPSTTMTGLGVGAATLVGAGGLFGGAGASSSWDSMGEFSSASSYTPPRSSSGGSSSSGGGGGGGW